MKYSLTHYGNIQGKQRIVIFYYPFHGIRKPICRRTKQTLLGVWNASQQAQRIIGFEVRSIQKEGKRMQIREKMFSQTKENVEREEKSKQML